MNTLFQNILTASFHGSIVILAVMLLRLVLKKTPRKYICLLWLLAGLRLLMPFQIQSDLSLQPSADPVAQVQQQISRSQTPAAPEDFSPADLDVPAPVQTPEALPDIQAPVTTVISSTPSPAPETAPEPDTGVDFLSVLPWFWLGIACCFGIYSLYTYLTLKLKVREAVRIPGGWECDRIETAFILGFIRPNIYIPMGMTPGEQRYILAHERTHLDKGDHWFKMVGFLALALHWFNPLVWAAYILLCKDIEIACDERVVQFMELEERKAYSAALLNCSTNRAHFAACPVAFGEVSVKERIKSVLSYKKPGFWISLVGVIAIVFVAVCLVPSPARKDAAAAGDTEPTSVSDAVSVHNVDELLAAIAPDTVIQLESGTYNLSSATGYGLPSESPYYAWTEKYDGFELMLQNVKNLTIRGSGKVNTTLECDPRSASVINLKNCENVTLEDFTAGHTLELGQCSSGVIYLQNCTGVGMNRLGIYGCGMIGLQAADSKDISLADSDVYDCSSSAAEIISCEDVTISGTRIYRIGSEEYGGYTYFDIGSSRNVTVENCEISDSSLMYLAIVSGSTVQMKGNLFSNNRSQLEAFNFQYEYHEDTQTPADESSMVLDGNRFENCSVRRWFGADGTVTDGVLRFQDSDHITVDKCGLYGCGILGVDAEYCTDIRVANCDIYECSQGGVQFWSSEGIVMENNTLRDLGGSDMSFHDCKDVTVNGETVIPASMFLSLILQSEEQQGTEALNAFVTEFAYAYFYGDMDTLPRLLSKDYTGGVEAYSGNTNDVIVCWHEVTVDMWKEAEANGTYEFAYPYRENVDSEIAYLTIVVVRENDAWKVSSYSLAE